MSVLTPQIYELCNRNRDGSFATQADRRAILLRVFGWVWDAGYKLRSLENIKPKHVDVIVATGVEKGLSPGTMKNVMGAVRWCADKVGKRSIMKADNASYGIAERKAFNGNKAKKLDLNKLDQIPCERMQMSLRLIAAFGLRREEALKFKPKQADGGTHVKLAPGWTKGMVPRSIPITTARQRLLLDEAVALFGNESLIPQDKKYIEHRRSFMYRTLGAGISNVHGLRHNYAQWRFKTLTGFPCPAAGGPTKAEMTAEEWARCYAALKEVSRELGHERVDVTVAYLGYFSGQK